GLSDPETRSQRWIAPLWFSVVAMVLPSGENATHLANESTSLVRPQSRPSATFQNRTTRQLTLASLLPSGVKATVVRLVCSVGRVCMSLAAPTSQSCTILFPCASGNNVAKIFPSRD